MIGLRCVCVCDEPAPGGVRVRDRGNRVCGRAVRAAAAAELPPAQHCRPERVVHRAQARGRVRAALQRALPRRGRARRALRPRQHRHAHALHGPVPHLRAPARRTSRGAQDAPRARHSPRRTLPLPPVDALPARPPRCRHPLSSNHPFVFFSPPRPTHVLVAHVLTLLLVVQHTRRA